MDPVAQTLLLIAGLLLLGAVGEYVFSLTRIPDVVWLVAAGILCGPILELVSPKMLKPGVPFFGAIALTVILSSSAFKLRLADVAAAAPRGILLGLCAFVAASASIWVMFFIAFHIGVIKSDSPLGWLIVGTIVGGTSSDVLMPSIGRCKVPPRVARMLEVESAATDALTVVVVMVLMDLLLSGQTDLARPVLALGREVGIGFAAGIIAAMLMFPGIPRLRDKPHGYTVFLAAMLGLYGITTVLHGSGAIAVLVAAILVGNAPSVVTYLIPGAKGELFTASDTTNLLQDQFTFLIKSFFFFLIGLMFPTGMRLIGLALVATVFLLLSRIPVTLLTTRGMNLSRKEFWFTTAAIPRGLAAGVLATLPYRLRIPYSEDLASGVFAVIVITAIAFAVGFTLIGRLTDEHEEPRGASASTDLKTVT